MFRRMLVMRCRHVSRPSSSPSGSARRRPARGQSTPVARSLLQIGAGRVRLRSSHRPIFPGPAGMQPASQAGLLCLGLRDSNGLRGGPAAGGNPDAFASARPHKARPRRPWLLTGRRRLAIRKARQAWAQGRGGYAGNQISTTSGGSAG
jgi:hypothetical protein